MLSLPELVLKTKVDSSGAKAGLKDLEKSADSASSGIAGKFKSLGGKIGKFMKGAAIAGAAALGAALIKVGKDALDAYKDFEQLQGGIEKIFDEADQDKIFEDAKNAYKDLNLSANDYLTTITNVGAAFASTMGDQKGYDVARQGMLAVSDYATGTGKNVEQLNEKFQMISRSTSSYQSIADQFAGLLPQTSKDFLAQAQAAGYLSDEYKTLTEVPVAEYQQALVEMMEQGTEKMGLAGNTAAETATTIEGSLAAAKASWQNLLTALGTGDEAEIQTAVDNFVESFSVAVQNIVPRLGTIFKSLFTTLWNMAGEVDWTAKISELFDKFIDMLKGVSESGKLGDFVKSVLSNLYEIIIALLPKLLELIPVLLDLIWQILTSAYEAMISTLAKFWGNIFSKIKAKIQEVWTHIKEKVSSIIQWVGGKLSAAKDKVVSIFTAIKDGIVNRVKSAVSTAKSVFAKIKDALTHPIETAKDKIKGIVDKIKGFFTGMKLKIPNIPLPHFSVSPAGWKIGDLLKGSLPKLNISWYKDGGFFNGGPTVLSGLGEAGPEYALPLNRQSLAPLASMLNELMRKDRNSNSNNEETIIVNTVLEVDGRVIAKTTAPYMKKAIDKIDTAGQRQLGLV